MTTMHLHSIHIENFRGLGDATIYWRPGVNVLVGRNNSCKTAVLDSLRLCLAIGSDQPDILMRRDDFHVAPNGDVASTVVFDLVWRGLTDQEKGVFADMLALSPDDTPELQLHVRFEYDVERERSRRRYWGGEKEGQAISSELLDLLEYVHLGALRDATRDLAPGRGNQLSRLFLRLARGPKGRNRLAREANEKMRSMNRWKRLLGLGKGRINEHLARVSLRDAPQTVAIDFLETQFRQIVESLRIQILLPATDESTPPSFFNIWQNGLGYNNLIYIATVLGDLLKRRARFPYASVSLLIEEPEAHLHPQLQDVLFRYLQEIEEQNIQVFVTSHSPTITAKTRLESLVVLTTENGTIRSTPLRNIALNEQHILFLQRFLDVTKCQLFFANSVILVEGISEALLMPSFAKAMGIQYDLDRNAVEVVNVDGVAFESFARLFNSEEANERINVRCAILTDDDRALQAVGTSDISSRAERAKRLEAGLLRVSLAKKTFEYELFLGNEELVTSVYGELHPRTNLSFAGTLNERAATFADKVRDNRDKAIFAQTLALKVEQDSTVTLVVPEYIRNAVRWATEGTWEEQSVVVLDE